MSEKYKTATKIFLAVQAILAVGAFILIYSSGSSSAPLVGQSIFEPDLTFELKEGEQILISDNPQFENSFILESDSELQLLPGTYYWKIKRWNGESEVKTFVVNDRAVKKGEKLVPGEGNSITSISIETGNSVKIGGENE